LPGCRRSAGIKAECQEWECVIMATTLGVLVLLAMLAGVAFLWRSNIY
jgi:hypothetical protein